MNRYSDYDAFAWLYNREWTTFGEHVFPGLKRIAGDKLPDGAKILDICCGTGQLARVMTEKGYRVTGIDGSKEMLRYAKENAPNAEFILDDARTFQLPPEYNAVFSTFDALNHVMTIDELGKVFKNTFSCLAKGGIFIFDMTTKKHFETRWSIANNINEKADCLYLLRPTYNAEKKVGDFKCTIFRPEGKNWKCSDITLHQTWYPVEDIKSALKKAGFTAIKAHSFTPQHVLEEGTEESTRVFFYAEKP
jgi:SAM-dependent methyltransferase